MSLIGKMYRKAMGIKERASLPYAGGIDFDRELPFLAEQIQMYQSVQPIRISGPNTLENFTNETAEMRMAYRAAFAEPTVKAALTGKIFAVMSLGLNVKTNGKTPLDTECADFVKHSLDNSDGGIPAIVWSILSGGLTDGTSLCEPVWKEETRGKYAGNKSLQMLKAKDINYIQFEVDQFRNVVSVISMRGNTGQRFSPTDFVIFRYMPLFENPFGQSDLRAAYRAITMIPAILKLRMIYLDKFTGPYIHAKSADRPNHQALSDILAEARVGGIIVTAPEDEIDIIDMATKGTSDFTAAIEDLRKETAISISGAFLTMMTGGGTDQRGDSGVQQDTVDLFIWMLANSVSTIINKQLVPDLVDINYGTGIEYPTVALSTPNPERIVSELGIDLALDTLGFPLDVHELSERTSRRIATDPARMLKKPTPLQPADDPNAQHKESTFMQGARP